MAKDRTAIGTDQERVCSFCKRPESEVGALISGKNEAYICRHCITQWSPRTGAPTISSEVVKSVFGDIIVKMDKALSQRYPAPTDLVPLTSLVQTLGTHVEKLSKLMREDQLIRQLEKQKEEMAALLTEEELRTAPLDSISPKQWETLYRLWGLRTRIVLRLVRYQIPPHFVAKASRDQLKEIKDLGDRYVDEIIRARPKA
ncbi:MAG: ClpX C4-type zinc finger protein [Candidatus Roizmanbacteria bacterium]|nr:MAG: ClpX C4-type zinc finger protein [Candidatus Roizmanbacteria bacterium]